jgi:hypothetical protein
MGYRSTGLGYSPKHEIRNPKLRALRVPLSVLFVVDLMSRVAGRGLSAVCFLENTRAPWCPFVVVNGGIFQVLKFRFPVFCFEKRDPFDIKVVFHVVDRNRIIYVSKGEFRIKKPAENDIHRVLRLNQKFMVRVIGMVLDNDIITSVRVILFLFGIRAERKTKQGNN